MEYHSENSPRSQEKENDQALRSLDHSFPAPRPHRLRHKAGWSVGGGKGFRRPCPASILHHAKGEDYPGAEAQEAPKHDPHGSVSVPSIPLGQKGGSGLHLDPRTIHGAGPNPQGFDPVLMDDPPIGALRRGAVGLSAHDPKGSALVRPNPPGSRDQAGGSPIDLLESSSIPASTSSNPHPYA